MNLLQMEYYNSVIKHSVKYLVMNQIYTISHCAPVSIFSVETKQLHISTVLVCVCMYMYIWMCVRVCVCVCVCIYIYI